MSEIISLSNTRDSTRTLERLKLAERYERPLPDICADRTALIVVDMQNIFSGLWESAENQADLEVFHSLIREMRTAGCTIIRTQHGHINPEEDGGELHRWWGSSIIEGSIPHEFIPGFEPEAGDFVVKKRRYNAFYHTRLEEILTESNTNLLVVGGVMTNLCCETTAREAFNCDYPVVFLADGTATVTEEMQRGTLRNLGFGFAGVKSCRQVAGLLEESRI